MSAMADLSVTLDVRYRRWWLAPVAAAVSRWPLVLNAVLRLMAVEMRDAGTGRLIDRWHLYWRADTQELDAWPS